MGVFLNHEDSFCRPLPQPECRDSGQWSRTLRALDLDRSAVAHIEANDVAAFGR